LREKVLAINEKWNQCEDVQHDKKKVNKSKLVEDGQHNIKGENDNREPIYYLDAPVDIYSANEHGDGIAKHQYSIDDICNL